MSILLVRYAQSLYASCEALANESKHEVDRYCYLNLEVQRLTRVFEEQRQLHAQQHDQIRSVLNASNFHPEQYLYDENFTNSV
jgi:hypothetical protein